ncbi:hypothetical protein ACJIZ3_007192 [Penstemon smallii]|uniref:Uncharacterized protein n=1 Tax=Penstemon smallii TaxID=265156 RepID=A0ABD3SAB6_9LAMI
MIQYYSNYYICIFSSLLEGSSSRHIIATPNTRLISSTQHSFKLLSITYFSLFSSTTAFTCNI